MKLFDKLFNTAKPAEPAHLTTITRTEVLEGFSLPGIIHNMQYHFTDLQVYADGLIYCWEMVDLALFKKKLERGWVVPSIPDGSEISIFGLGGWVIEQGKWHHTKESLYDYVYSLVKRLNPTLENLHDYGGSNTRMVGSVNVSKHSTPNDTPYYLADPGSVFPKRTNGARFPVFFRNDDGKTYLVDLSIYPNGQVALTNLPVRATFQYKVVAVFAEQGRIVTEPDPGETVTILGLGSFVIKSGSGVPIGLKLLEIDDKYQELNGRENSVARCARVFEAYKKAPTKKLLEELRQAYEAVPEHQRIFVGDMDTKDYEVRQIIYGDKIKKEWEDHYGFAYPFADMPRPVDE